MITEFDGLEEYIGKFTDAQLVQQYKLGASNWGRIPLTMIFEQAVNGSAIDFQRNSEFARKQYAEQPEMLKEAIDKLLKQKDEDVAAIMQLAGEYVLGHKLALLNLNVVGGGVADVRKGTEGARFFDTADWKRYFESTAFGRELLATIVSDNKAQYFNAPDILNAPLYNWWQ